MPLGIFILPYQVPDLLNNLGNWKPSPRKALRSLFVWKCRTGKALVAYKFNLNSKATDNAADLVLGLILGIKQDEPDLLSLQHLLVRQ